MEHNASIIETAITGCLSIIEQDREREIIARRFGLTGERETLEQIGAQLNITRERVRQLEKAILIRLRIGADEGHIPELPAAEKLIIRNLTEMGRVARIPELAARLFGHEPSSVEHSQLLFISTVSKALSEIPDNEFYYASVGIATYGTPEDLMMRAEEIIAVVKKTGHPMTLEELDESLNYEHPDNIRAIASISKQLSSLNDLWGLSKWPAVNPRNIRDKIFVVLEANREPMHFSDIAKAISASDFHRKNVTTQAIHNELIKDKRFILIGRGIYALDSWGYTKGTVSEIITRVLRDAGEPLSREEIVKRVLRARKVKETTVLLNLQNKELFDKVDKDAYTLAKGRQ